MSMYKLKLAKIIVLLQGLLQISVVKTLPFGDIFKQIREHEFEAYQTIIMHDEQTENLETGNEIFQAAIKITPSRIINFIQQDPMELKTAITSRSYHESTLFVVVLENSAEIIEKFFDFMKQVTGHFTFPRCLMVMTLNESSSSREVLLRSAWSRNIIQLTILDIELESNMSRGKLSMPQGNIVIHYFNNFTGVYTKMNYNKGGVLFPNKLKNLNGYEMKAFDDQVLNKNNHNIPKLKSISNIMNFSLVKVYSTQCDSGYSIDSFICNYAKMKNSIRNSTCNLALNTYLAHANDEEKDNLALSISLGRMYSTLLPKQKITKYLFTKSIYLAIFSCVFIVLLWTLFRFLKFNRHFWTFLHLWELLLGMSVPLDVEKLRDRIALMTLCFGFLVFSSSLHSMLTTVELFSDYKDILKSKDGTDKWIVKFTDFDGALDIEGINTTIPLMKRTNNYTGIEDCLNDLFNNKAVACDVNIVSARQLILMDLKENGISTIKILENDLIEYASITVFFVPNSPFVFELERHMNRFLQTGLTYKWHEEYRAVTFKKIKNVSRFFENENSFTIKPFITLGIGLVIAIIVFIAELLF